MDLLRPGEAQTPVDQQPALTWCFDLVGSACGRAGLGPFTSAEPFVEAAEGGAVGAHRGWTVRGRKELEEAAELIGQRLAVIALELTGFERPGEPMLLEPAQVEADLVPVVVAGQLADGTAHGTCREGFQVRGSDGRERSSGPRQPAMEEHDHALGVPARALLQIGLGEGRKRDAASGHGAPPSAGPYRASSDLTARWNSAATSASETFTYWSVVSA